MPMVVRGVLGRMRLLRLLHSLVRPRTETGVPANLALWKDGDLFQAGSFGQAEHKVHVLHRLSGSSLGQIVLNHQNHELVPALRAMYGNAQEVGCPNAARFG